MTKYLIHSTQPVPAHIADVTGRAICGCGIAAWKKTPARSGYKAGEWQLVDGKDADRQIWGDDEPVDTCLRCIKRQAVIDRYTAKKARAK